MHTHCIGIGLVGRCTKQQAVLSSTWYVCAEIFQPQNNHITPTIQMYKTLKAALTTISPSMVTLGADMRRDIVRLGAIFPPPSAPPPFLCFISTELPSTAPADFRQAQQFPILCLEYWFIGAVLFRPGSADIAL